jgi:hypothetical protein
LVTLFFEDWAGPETVLNWKSHAEVKKRTARTPMARMMRIFTAAPSEGDIGRVAKKAITLLGHVSAELSYADSR